MCESTISKTTTSFNQQYKGKVHKENSRWPLCSFVRPTHLPHQNAYILVSSWKKKRWMGLIHPQNAQWPLYSIHFWSIAGCLGAISPKSQRRLLIFVWINFVSPKWLRTLGQSFQGEEFFLCSRGVCWLVWGGLWGVVSPKPWKNLTTRLLFWEKSSIMKYLSLLQKTFYKISAITFSN